jgi:hypothetical protein
MIPLQKKHRKLSNHWDWFPEIGFRSKWMIMNEFPLLLNRTQYFSGLLSSELRILSETLFNVETRHTR